MRIVEIYMGIMITGMIILLVVLSASPVLWPLLIVGGLVGAAIVVSLSVKTYLWFRRDHFQRLAANNEAYRNGKDALRRSQEPDMIRKLAQAIDLPEIIRAADKFADRHFELSNLAQPIAPSEVARMDHVRRTLIEIMQAAHNTPGEISSQLRLEIMSNLEISTRLVETILGRLDESIQNDALTSSVALSTQLKRMVRLHGT